jgi:DNA polymerase-3 subunit epsilon
LRLAIEKNKKQLQPVHSFHYLVDGHSILRKLIKDFDLCPRLCFMQKTEEPCDETCRGACVQKESPAAYNKRVEQAIASFDQKPSFAIVDRGLNADDKSCILIENGKLYGMGYLPLDIQVADLENLKDHLQLYKENSFIRNLINGYAARYPHKVMQFKTVELTH